jgi:hypothetical protein
VGRIAKKVMPQSGRALSGRLGEAALPKTEGLPKNPEKHYTKENDIVTLNGLTILVW